MKDNNFRKFIRNNLIDKNGKLSGSKIRIKWCGFEEYKEKYLSIENKKDRYEWLYKIYYNIKELPKCECGENKKFLNFTKGYDKCILKHNCPVYKKECSDKNKKINYDIKWFEFKFSKEIVRKYLKEFESVKNYFNKNKIQINKKLYILNWIKKYIELGIDDWVNKIDRTMKAFENDELNSKDTTSEKSIIIRYGKEFLYLLNDKKQKIKYGNSLQKFIDIYGDNKKAREEWENLKFKRGTSLEAFIYRNGEKEGKRKYEEYWKNTTFAISKERFIQKYGDNWKFYYDQRIKLHSDKRKKNSYYNENFHNCSKEEFENNKNECYKKASESKRKENVYEKLKIKGYTDNEIKKYFDKRWNQTSLNGFIRKFY